MRSKKPIHNVNLNSNSLILNEIEVKEQIDTLVTVPSAFG